VIRRFLPYFLQRELFGDRRRWGNTPRPDDPDWQRWQAVLPDIYRDTQRQGPGLTINDAGYTILRHVDVDGKRVAEIGPGGAFHLDQFRGRPSAYNLVDVDERFLATAKAKALARGLPVATFLSAARDTRLPFDDHSHDVVVSFYSLEHLAPLPHWLSEIRRILKPGGLLVGGIPAEGGLMWGMGRWFTSRRVMQQRYGVDVRKVICWEHVNFCDDILTALQELGTVYVERWPVRWAPLDLTVIVKFIVQMPQSPLGQKQHH
jgi:SAM-dependent methyltransferase